MDDYINRKEHDAEMRRLDEENRRQNSRISDIEDTVKEINRLTVSVAKLAQNMEQMLQSQDYIAKRLNKVEERDGNMWRKVSGYVVVTVVGITIGYIFKQIGM